MYVVAILFNIEYNADILLIEITFFFNTFAWTTLNVTSFNMHQCK